MNEDPFFFGGTMELRIGFSSQLEFLKSKSQEVIRNPRKHHLWHWQWIIYAVLWWIINACINKGSLCHWIYIYIYIYFCWSKKKNKGSLCLIAITYFIDQVVHTHFLFYGPSCAYTFSILWTKLCISIFDGALALLCCKGTSSSDMQIVSMFIT